MRKLTLTLAAAGAALAFAAPASAQYYPQPAYGYGNAYGYNNYGQARALQARIDGIQRQVENLRARRMITRNEANGLRSEARSIQYRLAAASRYGLNYNEARNIEYRVAKLEQHVRREARDGRGWNGNSRYGNAGYGYNNGYGYNSGAYYTDNDHDGDDDGDEHDRWHAEHDDHDD